MKDLSFKELSEAPHLIQFIYTMAIAKQPIGTEMYERAIKEHPEYFEDVLEHRRKWALIPESVHEEYNKERELIQAETYKELPESKGMLWWIRNPEGFEEWNKKWKECYDREKPLLEALHKKFYGPYGIEYYG